MHERMIFWCLELMGLLGLSKTQKSSFELSLKYKRNRTQCSILRDRQRLTALPDSEAAAWRPEDDNVREIFTTISNGKHCILPSRFASTCPPVLIMKLLSKPMKLH